MDTKDLHATLDCAQCMTSQVQQQWTCCSWTSQTAHNSVLCTHTLPPGVFTSPVPKVANALKTRFRSSLPPSDDLLLSRDGDMAPLELSLRAKRAVWLPSVLRRLLGRAPLAVWLPSLLSRLHEQQQRSPATHYDCSANLLHTQTLSSVHKNRRCPCVQCDLSSAIHKGGCRAGHSRLSGCHHCPDSHICINKGLAERCVSNKAMQGIAGFQAATWLPSLLMHSCSIHCHSRPQAVITCMASRFNLVSLHRHCHTAAEWSPRV